MCKIAKWKEKVVIAADAAGHRLRGLPGSDHGHRLGKCLMQCQRISEARTRRLKLTRADCSRNVVAQ
jgi:hypothetical protein